MVIPNIVMKFKYVDIFEHFVKCWSRHLLTPAACMVSLTTPLTTTQTVKKPMVIPNIVMKFKYVDIFEHFVKM